MAVDIDTLQIQIRSDSQEAASGIEKLANTLERLKTATKGIGLGSVSTQMKGIAEAAEKLAGSKSASGKIQSLANALGSMSRIPSMAAVSRQLTSLGEGLQALSSADLSSTKIQAVGGMLTGLASVPKLTGMTTISKQLTSLAGGLTALSAAPVDQSKIQSIVSAMGSLAAIGKASGLNSALNALRKIPEITKNLNSSELRKFGLQMQLVTKYITPLANEMQKVSNGFAAFPIRIQKLIASNAGLVASNNRAAKSFDLFGSSILSTLSRITLFGYSLRRVYGWMKSWVTESSAYVENLNLFTITMGDATDEALRFADAAHEALGIDPSHFIRNWGLFQNTLTGFGIVADKAHLMSKNLTQLAYDMASFFDTDVSTAMEKLQSAMTGQVRPLREFGYAIDQATLQQVAYAHNIDLSVAKMSQAQKAQLRYLTIMEHSKNVMGDMGRTIMTPANAMRVFGEQVTQLTRALGNLLIPALSKVLPYVQAFVEVLTEAIQRAAEFLGFVLPNIDYSGLDGATGGFDDMEEGIEGAEEAAKELKRTLLGFDELNIVSPTKNTVLDDLENDLDLNLPQYDFLEEVRKQTDEIKEMMQGILDVVLNVGAALIAWKVGEALVSGLKTVGELLAFAAGKQMALSSSAAGLLETLKALKIAAGIVLMVAGLTIEFSGAKAIGYGDAGLMDYVKAAIGAALGVAGALLIFGVNPLGWTIGLAAALTVFLTGITMGADQRLSEMVSEAFFSYNEGAITITELSTAYAVLLGNITKGNQEIIDSGAGLKVAQDNIQSVVGSYARLSKEIELGVVTLEESVPEMISLFQELADNIEESINGSHEVIMTGLFGSFGEALGYADDQLTDYAAATYGVTQASADAIRELKQTMAELEASYNAGQKDINEFQAEYSAAWQELAKYTSNDEIVNAFAGIDSALQGIDWESPTAAQDAFAIVSEAAQAAKQSVVDAAETMELALNEKIREAYANGQTEYAQVLEEMLGDVPKFIEQQNNEIAGLVGQYADIVQVSLVEGVRSAIDAAVKEWNDLPWWEQIFKFGGKEYKYITKSIGDYTKNIGIALSDDLKEQLEKVGYDGSFWVQESLEKILSLSRFSSIGFGQGLEFDLTDFQQTLSDAVNDEVGDIKTKLDEAIKNAGFDQSGVSIAENLSTGLIEGLKEQGNHLAEYVSSWASDITSTVESTFGIHSPSTVFRDQIGLNLGLGIAEGLADSMRPVTEEANSLANSISGAFDGMAFNIPATFQIPKIPTVDTSRTARSDPMISSEARAQIVGSISSRAIAADDSWGGFSDGMAEANEDVINALYAIATQIMRTIEEKDTNVYLDRERISRASAEDYERYRKTRGSSFVKRGV